ncbi:uncharacterized protein BO72DRAFT_448252 [Aspergillus fijiensis CBS 313.89]|uniref:Uncharacterized protein n=1 Tax=Aspergillus fijiensis CBS 313.89 TaxID=1448319 RepID=A0A8G1RRX9_9EURO|nr:uncharacterized protein BO72DRAFT_448252 [Aspergillus fijiensis CBS 313.89]RAK77183.1 hypothetical protein BO72DRAFT_448252 [Aspergillus fijiensis CBS 313.89]
MFSFKLGLLNLECAGCELKCALRGLRRCLPKVLARASEGACHGSIVVSGLEFNTRLGIVRTSYTQYVVRE